MLTESKHHMKSTSGLRFKLLHDINKGRLGRHHIRRLFIEHDDDPLDGSLAV
jgi:hypothetical protein